MEVTFTKHWDVMQGGLQINGLAGVGLKGTEILHEVLQVNINGQVFLVLAS